MARYSLIYGKKKRRVKCAPDVCSIYCSFVHPSIQILITFVQRDDTTANILGEKMFKLSHTNKITIGVGPDGASCYGSNWRVHYSDWHNIRLFPALNCHKCITTIPIQNSVDFLASANILLHCRNVFQPVLERLCSLWIHLTNLFS